MSANLRIAVPAQVAVARDKPAEQDAPPSDDDRFAHVLSQREPKRDDAAPPSHATAKAKSSDAAKSKEAKPGDTLQLLQSSVAIQPSVTPPAPTDVTANPTQPTATADDAATKTVAAADLTKTTAPLPLLAATASAADTTDVDGADSATATAAKTEDATRQPALVSLQSLLSPTLTAGDATASSSSTRVAQTATEATKPITLRSSETTADDTPLAPAKASTADPTRQDSTSPTIPPPTVAANAISQNDAMATKPDIQQTPNAPDVQTTTPILPVNTPATASAVAASLASAMAHRADSRDESTDDSIDGVGATNSSAATPTFAPNPTHDIAIADGKVPVPSPASPQFADALGAKLTWMAERHVGHAEIHLAPDELGAVDVRVHLNGEHVRAEFNSANADVRQAINDHLPRLRSMLSQHGFNLTDSHVGNGSQQASSQASQDDTAIATSDDAVELPAPRVSAYTHDGILDAFA